MLRNFLLHNSNFTIKAIGLFALSIAFSLVVFAVSYSPAGNTEAQLIITPTPVPRSCDDAPQRTALEAFYDALDGDNWSNNADWKTSAPLGDWYGLTVSESGCVQEIHLENNGLDGELTDLSALVDLRVLELNNNSISGEINTAYLPTSVHELILHHNEITGEIPELGEMHLTILELNNNQMSGEINPRHLTTELEVLRLNDNMFTGPVPDVTGARFIGLNPAGIKCKPIGQLSETASKESQYQQAMTALSDSLDPQRHPAGEGFLLLRTLDISNNMLTGKLPDMSKGVIRQSPNFCGQAIDVRLEEIVLYPGNPDISGVVEGEKLPLTTLKTLVIGHEQAVPDEDPDNPDRLCVDHEDFFFWHWAARSDTIFKGTYCGDVAPQSVATATPAPTSTLVPTSVPPTPTDPDDDDHDHEDDDDHGDEHDHDDHDEDDHDCEDHDDDHGDEHDHDDHDEDDHDCEDYDDEHGDDHDDEPSSTSKLGRIEPSANNLYVRPGDVVTLSVNIYGRQGMQDQNLTNAVLFEWKEGDRTLEGVGPSIAYSAPSAPGTYIITASLEPHSECHGLDDTATNCTASFKVQVLRSSPTLAPVPSPVNPPGAIPAILVDSNGNQYEIFTPVDGGQFTDGLITLTAGLGAVPNGDIVGLRADEAGPASNTGMTHQRYSLAGNSYSISAVDASGATISDYRLNSHIEFCAPLPDALRRNISDIATLVLNADGTLTVLSTSVRISDDAILGCANLSAVPATIALGTSGAPAAIPTASPEPEPAPPETGGKAPSSSARTWLLLLIGIAVAVAGVMLWQTRTQNVS